MPPRAVPDPAQPDVERGEVRRTSAPSRWPSGAPAAPASRSGRRTGIGMDQEIVKAWAYGQVKSISQSTRAPVSACRW
jgi:hypothetical protein